MRFLRSNAVPVGAHFHVIVNDRGLEVPKVDGDAGIGVLPTGYRRYTVRVRETAVAEADREAEQRRGVLVIWCLRGCLGTFAPPQLPPHDPTKEAPRD